MRNILEGFGGAATQSQISEMFVGDIFNEAEWKRWWESTKKLLKKEGYFPNPDEENRADQIARRKSFARR